MKNLLYMKIVAFGTGHNGFTTDVGFSETGNTITRIDYDLNSTRSTQNNNSLTFETYIYKCILMGRPI